jgi:hypothetical protein
MILVAKPVQRSIEERHTRHERSHGAAGTTRSASLLITTNLAFADWPQIFGDAKMTTPCSIASVGLLIAYCVVRFVARWRTILSNWTATRMAAMDWLGVRPRLSLAAWVRRIARLAAAVMSVAGISGS